MKKLLSVILAIMVCVSVCTSVSAVGFVSSPSTNEGPKVIESSNQTEDCEADIVVTPYSERDTLSVEKRELIEYVYDQIVNSVQSQEFAEIIEKLAKDKGVKKENLSVSDLFDLSYVNCTDHDEHGHFRIKLKADTLKNFVALLHFDGENWNVIKDAKVVDEVYLVFTADDFSPFAIVVNTNSSVVEGDNQTGQRFPWEYVVIMAVAAIGCVLSIIIYKKKKV